MNNLLQRRLGGLSNLPAHVDMKVNDDWVVFAMHMRDVGMALNGTTLFEVGTGWLPALPVCFHLGGAAGCVTVDLTRHMDAGLSFRMLAEMERHLETIAKESGAAPRDVEARYRRLREAASLDDLLARAAVTYRAPGDASRSNEPDSSFDAVFSNSVFEHVPGPVIQEILIESRRILKPGGYSMHSVNCGDHYAYFDRSISPVNYLRFTERQWCLWNNSILYQNRLRPGDFFRMAERAGLELVMTKFVPNPAAVRTFASLEIAPEFRGRPEDELCSTSVDFLGRRPVAS